MSSISWRHCIGQQRIKEVLAAALANNTVGHAYLFSGAAGCGTFAAALDFAGALLCENELMPPCGTCASCQKIAHYSHPDFHIIMPLALEKEHKDGSEISEEGWDYISMTVKKRLADPYVTEDHSKIPEIPVDWIRETNHTIQRGPLERPFNVIIIDGVDLLRKESANSLLKTLEEPRAGTIILLLTDRISAVLPTIVSRCQILRFSWLSPAEIREAMTKRYAIGPAEVARLDLVVTTGSLGASIALWNNPPQEDLADAAAFWNCCVSGNWSELAALVDALVETNNYSRFESLFRELMQRIRNTFLSELPGTENVFSEERTRVVDFSGRELTTETIEHLVSLCQKSLDAVKARANSTLVLAHFATALMEALGNGEKQQSR